MDGRQSLEEKSEHHGRLTTGVWMRYLMAGATLAVVRVALLVWLNRRLAGHVNTETDDLITSWLYPEQFLSGFWSSLVAFTGTKYYLAWGSLLTIGSFVPATPILFVRWLRQRNVIVQIALCGLTIPAITALLLAIVRLFGLDE
jgi:hypothetical protein